MRQSSLLGKIANAKRYDEEKNRISFTDFTVQFRGENDNYETSYHDGKWNCTCRFFATWETCSHTMALERILADMLPEEALKTHFDLVP
jgi:hypothetical protein